MEIIIKFAEITTIISAITLAMWLVWRRIRAAYIRMKIRHADSQMEEFVKMAQKSHFHRKVIREWGLKWAAKEGLPNIVHYILSERELINYHDFKMAIHFAFSEANELTRGVMVRRVVKIYQDTIKEFKEMGGNSWLAASALIQLGGGSARAASGPEVDRAVMLKDRMEEIKRLAGHYSFVLPAI